MSRLVRRVLKVVGLGLAVLLLVVTVSLAWLVGTESGSRLLLTQVGELVDGVGFGAVRGRLTERLELEDVEVRMDGLALDVSRLWLEWSPGRLLQGRLQVHDLGADTVVYRAGPAAEPDSDEPFTLPERIELPVAVHVARIAVTDLTLHTAPDADALQIDRIVLSDVGYVDSRFELNRLEVASPLLDAEGRIAATAAGDYPVDAELRWRLELPDYAPVQGTTAIDGSLAALQVDQRLAAPYHTTLNAQVSDALDPARATTVSARLAVNELRPPQIQDGLPEATLSLEVEADGPLDALEVRARADGVGPQQHRFVAGLEAALAPDAVTIHRLDLRQPERDGHLAGQGSIALAGAVAADLDIRWEALQWPLTGEPTVTSPRGALAVTGPLNDYRFSLTTRVEPAAAPPVDLALKGTGDRAGASFGVDLQSEPGRLDGQVRASWDPVIDADATLHTRQFDPSVFAADWPGAVDLTLEARGTMQDQRLQVVVSRLAAGGRLRGQPLEVSGRGEVLQNGDAFSLDVPDLTAALGATRFELNGQVAERAELRWQLHSPDLSELLPEARGRIAGSGRITGVMPRVDVEARLDSQDLGYGDDSLERFELQADVDLSGDTRSELRLAASGGTVAGTTAQTLTIDASGTPAGHRLELALDADAGAARLRLDGELEGPWSDQPIWRFRLTDGELGYADLAPWRLAGVASGRLALPAVQVDQHCWAAADARLCLGGRRGEQSTEANLQLTDLDFGYFAPLLPEDIRLAGAVDASVSLSQSGEGAWLGEADVHTTAGQLGLENAGEDGVSIALEPSRISVGLDASGARGDAELVFEHGRLQASGATSAVLTADGTGADGPLAEQSLTGQIRLDVPDLAFVSELAPATEEMAGRLAADLRLGGRIGAPVLTGALDLLDGTVTVPELGIRLDDLTASVQGLGRDGIALQAAARSGDGQVELDGRMSLPGERATARLTILGRDFEALNNDDGRVLVSPDLVVEADPERLTVTGAVHVPQAELSPGTQAPSAVTVSDDQVLVSPDADQPVEQQRELFAEVRLILGDDVRFDGFGLTARFEGDLLIDQQPATPTTATGEIRIVDGEYRAYGQGLVIDSGRVYFAGGPVTQPALDIRAVRRPAEGILVGAHVQGTLESPSFELYSEPGMTQQEQLSWLVLGRSLEDSPEGEGDALSRAALAMGLKGGDFLARNIGEQLGVDDIGIETGSGEAGAPSDPAAAALVVGKYLSPKLYVSYGIGLFNPESVLELQYELSRNWRLITQSSGEATGADVLYTVERGGN